MLKNVLSLLLSKFYSKKENETISHLATPNIANTVNVMLTTTESSAIVAPFDGYLNIETTAEGNPTINIWEALWCNATPISPFQAKIFVPVTKGQRIQYRVTGTISQARFVRLVGGGYKALKNALLQGGVLCLNSLSSSLRRSFLSVRRHGSATSLRPSYQGARKSPLSLAPILKTTQRRATELYVSILLTLRGQSSALLLIAGGAYFTARTKQEFIKCSRFLSQRVKRSTLTSQRIKAPLISSSFRLLAPQLNVVNGGASC